MYSPLNRLDDEALADRIRVVAHLKRFIERYSADPQFRELLGRDVLSTLDTYQLQASPADVTAFLQARADDGETRPGGLTDNLHFLQDFYLECLGGLEIWEAAARSTNNRFHLWRERQLARLRFDFSAAGDGIVRPVVAFELSKGCSVGCWFCAISAEKFGGNFAYGDGEEWRRTLIVLRDLLGPAAAAAFCYWATDPMDNPDYERFALTVRQELGIFPPTTTALALKSPQRTRSLLQLAHSHGSKLNRFSVLTLRMLDRLHREFSAEELAFVEIVPQNPGAVVFTNFPKSAPATKVRAGKVMEEESSHPEVAVADGTIACVTGFLINMVERTVRLVSPCMAGEEWPLGYRVHESEYFVDHADLGRQIESMIDRHMQDSLPADQPLRFIAGVQCSTLVDGFRVSSPSHAMEFRSGFGRFGPNYLELGELVRRGSLTASQALAEMGRGGSSPKQTQVALGNLWQSGILADTVSNRSRLVSLEAGLHAEVVQHD
jgi:radical SAM family RiPP maturation amino acid epimerase